MPRRERILNLGTLLGRVPPLSIYYICSSISQKRRATPCMCFSCCSSQVEQGWHHESCLARFLTSFTPSGMIFFSPSVCFQTTSQNSMFFWPLEIESVPKTKPCGVVVVVPYIPTSCVQEHSKALHDVVALRKTLWIGSMDRWIHTKGKWCMVWR